MSANTTSADGVEKKRMHFVIAGGSLGGLATGIALRELGHDTTILERDRNPLLHDQGAGIVAGGHSLEFLSKYNRCQRPVAIHSERRQYVDKDGNVVHSVNANHNMTSWDLTYHILRANYDGVGSPYCDVPPPNPDHGMAIHMHDRTVTGVQKHGEGVCVSWRCTSDPSVTGTIAADRLIGADGPNSFIRSLFVPNLGRKYAGYCALRGTVVEHEASDTARETFVDNFTFYHGPGIQILGYLIPGLNGTLEQGERLINFVYYTNFPEGSDALNDIMTDAEGRRHRITVPPGTVDPKAWKRQQELAVKHLPPQFAELMCKAKRPFVQAVTDVLSPENEFLDGRVVLIGDALAGFRPHTVASTSQAAFDAMIYADYMAGEVPRDIWKRRTMGYARFIHKRGVEMGNRSQHQLLPLEEYIRDRDEASIPIRGGAFPDWATEL
ncbi:monooxygenase [Coniochaeta sp. 2T2.1]|nr:monooxygenase [Coniochaeta sp. 2T2.1]